MSDYTRNTKPELLELLEEKQEKLYRAGIERRPTKMTEIEDIEEDFRQRIKVLREHYQMEADKLYSECKKLTGRNMRPTGLSKPRSEDCCVNEKSTAQQFYFSNALS